MKWLVSLALAAVVACGGSDDAAPRDTDPRQEMYNAFLETARADLEKRSPETQAAICSPDYQQSLIDHGPGSDAEKAIIQLAMGDACIEAGQYSDDAQYSSYYAQAPD